jgi:hypothetical protein
MRLCYKSSRMGYDFILFFKKIFFTYIICTHNFRNAEMVVVPIQLMSYLVVCSFVLRCRSPLVLFRQIHVVHFLWQHMKEIVCSKMN